MRFYTSILFIGLLMAITACRQLAKPLIKNYEDPYHHKVAEAGFEEKAVNIDGVDLHYVEGPNNGPALVLLHAQLMDWFDYSRVLPALAPFFHIYVVDYHGHGQTQAPDSAMSANRIGATLAIFMEQHVSTPAFVSGNSSGGLLTLWLAANRPELVRAVLLEDPPLFASEYPRIKQTIAYRSFRTSHTYLEENSRAPFLNYWIKNSSKFIEAHAGKNATQKLLFMVETYEEAHPGQPVELRFLPEMVRMMFRGLSQYDPAFGNAFYEGSWNAGFDHADALAKVQCPALLLHADFSFLEDGTLNGAMSQEDADKAMSLLKSGIYQRIAAQHVVHLDKPKEFVSIVKRFFLEEGEE